MDFYDAYNYLQDHPIFCDRFLEGLDIMVVKVCPETMAIENDHSKNTKTQVWLEHGPYLKDDPFCRWCHDLDLDCGGDTFEEAIINLAALVKAKYDEGKDISDR